MIDQVRRHAVILIGLVLVTAACGPGAVNQPTLPATPPATSPSASTAPPALPSEAVTVATVGGGPNVIAISGQRVWLELHRSNGIAALDPVSLEVTPYPKVDVHCGVASDGANAVWATSFPGGRLTRVDAATGEADLTLTVQGPCGIGASADEVWSTRPEANVVSRLDPETGEGLLEVEVLGAPLVVSPVGDLVYASGEGGGGWLMAIDPETGEKVAERKGPDAVLMDAVALGFDSLWTIGRMDSRMYRMDPATLETVAMIEIGGQPSGLAVLDGSVWASRLAGVLYRVDPATNAVTGAWSLPFTWLSWPTVGFDRLWMTSLEEDAVIAVDVTKLD